MLSMNRFLIPAALGAALLLAACGGSSQHSGSTAASASPAASKPASASPTALTIGTASGSVGTYLTGASGRALYLWIADKQGRSVCSGSCAQYWPPLTAGSTPKVANGVTAAHITLITRSDGSKQVAYNGHPLYYFIADTSRGMTTGEGNDGFGAKWWLVSPAGNQITTSGSAAGSSYSNGY